jgi:hypothetical protein
LPPKAIVSSGHIPAALLLLLLFGPAGRKSEGRVFCLFRSTGIATIIFVLFFELLMFNFVVFLLTDSRFIILKSSRINLFLGTALTFTIYVFLTANELV